MCWVTLNEKSLSGVEKEIISMCVCVLHVHNPPQGINFLLHFHFKVCLISASFNCRDGKQQSALSLWPPAHPHSLGYLFLHITSYIALCLFLTYLQWLMKADIQFSCSVIVIVFCPGDGIVLDTCVKIMSSLRFVFFVRPQEDFFVRLTGIWSLDVCLWLVNEDVCCLAQRSWLTASLPLQEPYLWWKMLPNPVCLCVYVCAFEMKQ